MIHTKNKLLTNDEYAIDGRSWFVYDNGTDVIAYNSSTEDNFSVEMKEWIYARKPNALTGSRYNWSFSSMGRRVRLDKLDGGRV